MKKVYVICLVCALCLSMCACVPATDTMSYGSGNTSPTYTPPTTTTQNRTVRITADNIEDYFVFTINGNAEYIDSQYNLFGSYRVTMEVDSYLKVNARLNNVTVTYTYGYVQRSVMNMVDSYGYNSDYQRIFENADSTERACNFSTYQDTATLPISGELHKSYEYNDNDVTSLKNNQLVLIITSASGEITLE